MSGLRTHLRKIAVERVPELFGNPTAEEAEKLIDNIKQLHYFQDPDVGKIINIIVIY